ncbi:MAG: AAA family ATPase [Neomegalonema sp.]|nr:AAA family ATPase [Neomegalonema sp.]
MTQPNISRLKIENYRSIRQLDVELAQLTVVTGANGVGKSNLYRSLELLQAAATGDLSFRLAREGGMASALWAGAPWRTEEERTAGARDRGKGPAQIRLSAEIDHLDYTLQIGLPRPTDAALGLDPVVKEELVRARNGKRWTILAQRKGPLLSTRNDAGRLTPTMKDLWLFETALSSVSELSGLPELEFLRRRLAATRFYHQLRCDPEAPARRPQPAIMTTSVDSAGVDWATAIASTMRIEQDGFAQSPAARAVADAFDGGALEVAADAGAISVGLRMPAFQRAFAAPELSDGTLRFLILVAALSALQPPSFLALNEPEASLHESMIPPLADMIAAAAERAQILVVTHSQSLADRLDVEHGACRLRLKKEQGETVLY